MTTFITITDDPIEPTAISYVSTPADSDPVTVPRNVTDAAFRNGLSILTSYEYQKDLTSKWDAGYSAGVDNHKTTVREGIIEYFRDVLGDSEWREQANGLLEHFGYDTLTNKWRVTVTDDESGDTVLVVVVEADDEDAAREDVEGDLEQGQANLTLTWNYGGEGEVEEDNEIEDDSDAFFDGRDLSFDVEAVEE
jgi:hypothetical protein